MGKSWSKIECPHVLVVYFAICFKNGTGKELGDCKCGAQTPGDRDMNKCVWLGVETEYHHHVLSDGGLCLWFKVFGWVNKVKIIRQFFYGR